MPDNGQNRDFNNRDLYNAINPSQPGGGRNNGVGQVQPNAPQAYNPPYGEPRMYGGGPQPYQPQQLYGNNKPNPPYPGYSSPKPPPASGYSAPPPKNSSAPASGSSMKNPYNGSTNKMYGGSHFNDGDTVYEQIKESRRSKRMLIIISVALLLAIAGIVVFMLFFKGKGGSSSSDKENKAPAAVTENSNPTVTKKSTVPSYTEPATEAPTEADYGDLVETPDVVGDNMRMAKVKLEEKGFRVKFAQEYSNEIAPDNVIYQNVAAGKKVPLDTEITLTVSKGREPDQSVEVPSVKGKKYQDASDALTALGLKVELEFFNSSTTPKDEVIAQSISSGTSVDKGTKVVLSVSKGSEASSAKYGIVNTKETALNIRQMATTDSKIIGGADKGEKVEIIGEDGSWYIIKYKNVKGYVSKDYIKLV
ncbi:MAG: PASTA domain-containing protein [Ruminococcus sp.]|nr:PASTA domain-containing protein [Ruminococcus sp.]